MIRVARVDLGLTYRGGLYIISEQEGRRCFSDLHGVAFLDVIIAGSPIDGGE